MSKEIERKWLLKGGDFSFPDKANVIREKYKFPWPEMIATEVTGVPKYSMAGYWVNTRENPPNLTQKVANLG